MSTAACPPAPPPPSASSAMTVPPSPGASRAPSPARRPTNLERAALLPHHPPDLVARPAARLLRHAAPHARSARRSAEPGAQPRAALALQAALLLRPVLRRRRTRTRSSAPSSASRPAGYTPASSSELALEVLKGERAARRVHHAPRRSPSGASAWLDTVDKRPRPATSSP